MRAALSVAPLVCAQWFCEWFWVAWLCVWRCALDRSDQILAFLSKWKIGQDASGQDHLHVGCCLRVCAPGEISLQPELQTLCPPAPAFVAPLAPAMSVYLAARAADHSSPHQLPPFLFVSSQPETLSNSSQTLPACAGSVSYRRRVRRFVCVCTRARASRIDRENRDLQCVCMCVPHRQGE